VTDLQRQFLMYTFIYFLLKGSLYVSLYVATIIAEKNARERHAKLKEYLQVKRTDEKTRWKRAYDLYDQKSRKKSKKYYPTDKEP